MARAQGLGMRLTQNVADPGRLGSLELTGPLAGAPACSGAWVRHRPAAAATAAAVAAAMPAEHAAAADTATCAPLPRVEAAQALPDGLRRRLRPLQGGAFGGVRGLACPADTAALQAVQRAAGDEGLRRAAWEACHRSPADNLAVLDALVEVGAAAWVGDLV